MLNLDKMKAPNDPRPTWRNGVIQIHVTRACDLSCTSCTQGSNLSGKPTIITLENFEIAVKSLRGYNGVIGIFGGNPTLHPKFGEICEILQHYISFDQRGLWSNNLNGYGKLCREIFNPNYSNLNVHGIKEREEEIKRDWPEKLDILGQQDSRHSPPFVAMKDLDISLEEQERLIENCDINQLWSAMVCQFRGELRGFFCELAGAQSMLHENEIDYPDTGIPIYDDLKWWKFPIHQFEGQIKKHCFECGIPLRGKGDLSQGKEEFVSKTHQNIYNLKRKDGKTINLVSKREQLNGTVNRATDYIQNGMRSMNENVKILVALPTAEFARRADFYDYFNQLTKPEGTLMCSSHGQSPSRNRNIMIRQALENNCTHLFFVDDDVIIPPDALMRLLSHDKDIITGLYLMRNYPHYPIIFDEAYTDGRCRFSFLQKGRTGVEEIVNTGFGCVLIKTSVFTGMVEKGETYKNLSNEDLWLTLGELEKDHWCDDISFFLRARKAGFKLFVDLDVQVGHMVSANITPVKLEDGSWSTQLVTTASAEGVRFPQIAPSVEELKEKVEEMGVTLVS